MINEENISVKGKLFRVIRQSSLGKTASARVRGNDIIIKLPLSLPREEAFGLFVKLRGRMVKKIEEGRVQSNEIEFQDGQTIALFGKTFVIAASESSTADRTSSARLEDNGLIRITLARHATGEARIEHITALARKVIARNLLPEVEKRVRELNGKHYGFELNEVSISKANITRWGSCSPVRKRIRLDFRLLFFPEAVRDSVIIHELCHLKEGNHSNAFWELVRKAMPDYRENRKWLNKNGAELETYGLK